MTTTQMNAAKLADSYEKYRGRTISFVDDEGKPVRGALFNAMRDGWDAVIVFDSASGRTLRRVGIFNTQITIEDEPAPTADETAGRALIEQAAAQLGEPLTPAETCTAPKGATRVTFERDGRKRIAEKSSTTDRWSLGGSMLSWDSLIAVIGDAEASFTPAEARTDGVSDVQAALADEIATVRAILESRSADKALRALARLDRIAAIVPQRAINGAGRMLSQHACGAVEPGGHYCRCGQPGEWRALYTVAGS